MLDPVAGTLARGRGQGLQEVPQHGHSGPPEQAQTAARRRRCSVNRTAPELGFCGLAGG
jgi:hypothetical protein